MQKQEKTFSVDHRSSFWIKLSFGIGHPPAIHQMQCICVGEGSRVPNLQTEFNYLDSFKSYGIFSDFVVPTWSPLSSHRPCHPHVVHIIPTSSSHHPHSPQKVPMWSPWSVVSVVSTCCPCCPHIVPVIPTSSPSSPHHPHIIPIILSHPHSPQKVPMWSPWSVVSVVSSCCPRRPHIVPTSSRRSPHHPQPPRYPSHPPPNPLGVGGPKSVKMQ